LKGDEIDPASRIAAVANAFDSWTADRPYRPGMPPREALRQLYAGRGTLYDAHAVDALVKLVGVYPVGTNVMLNNGEWATVVSPNAHDTTRPIVRIWRDRMGMPLPKPRLVALEGTPLAITGVVAA
jgi:HD-GYP domain-containing protein (c-di-GMP phosphodiesterase class II)